MALSEICHARTQRRFYSPQRHGKQFQGETGWKMGREWMFCMYFQYTAW